MSHAYNFLIAIGIVSVFIILPLSYQMMKWHYRDPKRWVTFEFDEQVRPEDLRFSVLTSNLIIDKREMPYPVYRELSHLGSSFQVWLSQLPLDRLAEPTDRGRFDSVHAKSAGRKITFVSLETIKLTCLLTMPVCGFFLIEFPVRKAFFIASLIIFVAGSLINVRYYNEWTASKEGLILGRWFFKLSIPWSSISAFKMGLPEINERGARRAMFKLHMQFGDQSVEIFDCKFEPLLLLYRAIAAFRPDLKILVHGNNSSTQSPAGSTVAS
jgi:hypothetical protein